MRWPGWPLAVVATLSLASPGAAQPVLLSARTLFPHGCGSGPSIRGADFETHVAVNPRDPANIVGTWIDGSGITNVTASSRDGGRTWTESTVPGLRCTGDPQTVLSGDPWVSFGPDGILYLAGGTDIGGSDPASLDRFVKVVASRSLDGGRTWSQVTTVQTATDFNDKPAVTADPRRPGTAYLVFTRGHHPDFTAGDLMVSATHDGGVTWSRPVAIYAPLVPGTYPWGTTLRVLPDGTLLVTTMLWNPQGLSSTPAATAFHFQAVAFRSADGGATWAGPAQIAQVPVPRVQDSDRRKILRENPGVAMDVAPDGTAYTAWHQAGGAGDRAEVVLSKSFDGGLHWSDPRVVSDAVNDGFIPSLAVGADGTVGVTWYDLRGDRPGDDALTTDLWFARSRDRGGTWARDHVAGPFDMRTAALVDGAYFIGDYFGIAAMPGGFGATFALAKPLSRDGPSDVYFERLPPTGASPPAAAKKRLRVVMRHRVRAGRLLRLRVRVNAANAVVRVGNRRTRTGRDGIARFRIRFAHAGRRTVVASKPGWVSATAPLRVLPLRR